jgi:hypothetical protein
MNLHGISGGPPWKNYQSISKIQSVNGGGGDERQELKKNTRQRAKTVGKKKLGTGSSINV